jgi:hypothetical protein
VRFDVYDSKFLFLVLPQSSRVCVFVGFLFPFLSGVTFA